MPKPQMPLAVFLATADEATADALAAYANTTRSYLRHLARGYGNRKPGVELAVKIEEFTRKANRKNPKLPIVTCEDLAA